MNLIYTVAYDLPEERGSRTMAKLLCSSLLRSLWDGQIHVFHNSPDLLFPVGRRGVEEFYVDLDKSTRNGVDPARNLKVALEARFKAVELIDRPEQYEWIIYLDADCLALRDIEHLLVPGADILVQPELGRSMWDDRVFNGFLPAEKKEGKSLVNSWIGRDGINAGSFAVRGAIFREVMREWRRIYESEPTRHAEYRDQTAFNRFLLDTRLNVRPFERGEVMFPLHLNPGFLDYQHAALLHFVGGSHRDKINLAFALQMMKSFGDERGLYLDLIEV